MELRHIRYFLAVAREGNFTRAAAALGIGQPPLSMQIKDLEQEVGALLFHRTTYGADLTAAGEAFRQTVEEMPTIAERGIKIAQRAARGEIGRLCVGFSAASAFNPVVPRVMRGFRQAYPGVEISLEESNTAPLVICLHEGKVDVAFLRPGDVIGKDLELRMISEEPLMVALSIDHEALDQDEVDLAALAGDRFMLLSRAVGPDLYDTIMNTCRLSGLNPRIEQFAGQYSSILGFVAAALGVSIVPSSMSHLQVPGVVFRPIKDQVPATFLAVASQKGNTSTLVRNFMVTAAHAAVAPA